MLNEAKNKKQTNSEKLVGYARAMRKLGTPNHVIDATLAAAEKCESLEMYEKLSNGGLPIRWEAVGNTIRVNDYGHDFHHLEICRIGNHWDENRCDFLQKLITISPVCLFALRTLYDIQNGPPGIMDKEKWEEAMELSEFVFDQIEKSK